MLFKSSVEDEDSSLEYNDWLTQYEEAPVSQAPWDEEIHSFRNVLVDEGSDIVLTCSPFFESESVSSKFSQLIKCVGGNFIALRQKHQKTN